MNGTILALVIAILVVGIFIFVAITLSQNRHHGFNREEYQSSFLAITRSGPHRNRHPRKDPGRALKKASWPSLR